MGVGYPFSCGFRAVKCGVFLFWVFLQVVGGTVGGRCPKGSRGWLVKWFCNGA